MIKFHILLCVISGRCVIFTALQPFLPLGLRLRKAYFRELAVKVPLTWAGLRACRTLTDEDTMVNVTLCFSANQALLAAKAGATFVSPFIGRLDDIGEDGLKQLLKSTIETAVHIKAIKPAELERVIVDPTVKVAMPPCKRRLSPTQ